MTNVSQKLEAMRGRKGLSRDALGKAIGESASKIQAIEMGRQRIDHETLVKFIQFFGVDANWLLLDGETGDWETGMPPPDPGMHRVPIFDITASAGSGLSIFDQEVRAHVQFPLAMLAHLGSPDDMDIISVRGDSMVPDLADGDHAMVDRSQCTPGDGVYVVCVDDSLFVKRLQMLGARRAKLISSNASYPPFEVTLADPEDPDDIVQDVARIVGKVVWTGRAS